MSRLFRFVGIRVVLALVVVILGITAALVSVEGTSNASGPPPVDHHLCYMVTATGFKLPTSVLLKNQFNPTTGFRAKVGPVAFHCNPVVKTTPTQTFGITNSAAHLVCFKITATTQATHTVSVSNQFGTSTLTTGQPGLLCLPSWKSLTGPPKKTTNHPPGLSHFACYVVTSTSPPYGPPALVLQDQFGGTRATASSTPAWLCLPTQKTVGTHVYKVVNATTHLLCFPVSPTPTKTPVYDQNQFGTSKVTVGPTFMLCVPSTKTLIK